MIRMRSFYIACSLSTFMGTLLCSFSDYCGKKLERDTEYDNAVMAYSSYIREEILEVNLASCARKCFTYRCGCLAILYNRRMQSCKLLSARLNPQSIGPGPPVEGWVYYTTPKGCEPGWVKYRTHCYLIGQTEVTWIEAKFECEARCSHLVEIETKEESHWLAETFVLKDTCPSNLYDCVAWTGGNDRRIEGKYHWNDRNLSMTFTNWYPGQPSIGYPNQAEEKDCIDLFRNGRWNDRPCSHKSQYICEKSSGQNV